jgi:hypothetical protein
MRQRRARVRVDGDRGPQAGGYAPDREGGRITARCAAITPSRGMA